MAGEPLCSTHTAQVRERGGTTTVGELTGLTEVQWNRVRDDISEGQVTLGPYECCDLLSDVQPVEHELHIFRDGAAVWEGPITRMEFENDGINIFGEDILWVTKRRALGLEVDHKNAPYSCVELAEDYLTYVFGNYGDQWNGLPGLNKVAGPDDPETTRQVNKWSVSVFEELDHLARYGGIDYTVVNRDIFWFDTHLDWNPLADLVEQDIQAFPRIVEYGNQLANRIINTDGSGYAAIAPGSATAIAEFGQYVDIIIGNADDQSSGELDQGPPTEEELAGWLKTAKKNVERTEVMASSIIVPANTSLMPTSPWDIATVMPGSWFIVSIDRVCRTLSEYHKLSQIRVKEDGRAGESVQITTQKAPATRIVP